MDVHTAEIMKQTLLRCSWQLKPIHLSQRLLRRTHPSHSNTIADGSIRIIDFNKKRPRLKVATEEVATPLTAAESVTQYQIVNFYHLVQISDPDKVVAEHRKWIEGKDIRGRIYFSTQGVNAQFSGTVEDTTAYLQWLRKQSQFEKLRWNSDRVRSHMFPKLRLTHKPNLVQLKGGMSSLPITHPEQRATPLSPGAWKAKLAEATRLYSSNKAVVLDVRNGYEWDAGHFVGAERPSEDSFSETPTVDGLPTTLQTADKDTPVLMYCTGGIRCDIYSTVLRKNGFHNLYSLEGGVQRYFKEVGADLWNGSLFVFDGRMAIRPDKMDGKAKELPASVQCQVCGENGSVPHVNCANVDCNRLFIACQTCKTRLQGCCCEECIDSPRLLRPASPEGGRSAADATKRRIERRRRYLENVRLKRIAIREAKLRFKQMVQEEKQKREQPKAGVKEALESMRCDRNAS